MISTRVIILLVILCENLFSKICSMPDTGLALGFWADCPGITKEARITAKSLSKLQLILAHDALINSLINSTSYHYYQMDELAKKLDFKKKTVVYVTGYFDSNRVTIFGASITTQYMKLGYNALSLEYYAFTNRHYPLAVRFLRPVGRHVAEMLAELTKHGLDPKKLELIGLSHGGHAISFIAKNYRLITGRNISRLTGLDPAGPCLRNLGANDRLDASDADFVDVIHTNMDGFGMAPSIGHIDFYVNGGDYQLGDVVNVACENYCSHVKSYVYWLSALLHPKIFVGMQCDSVKDARRRDCFDRKPFVTNVMGLNVDKTKTGVFYVMTTYYFPYGMGHRGLVRENEVFRMFLTEDNNKADIVEL